MIYKTEAIPMSLSRPLMGVVMVTRPVFLILSPNNIFGMSEARHFKCRVLTDTEEYYYKHDRLPPKRMCSGSHNLFKCWEISDNILETLQDKT